MVILNVLNCVSIESNILRILIYIILFVSTGCTFSPSAYVCEPGQSDDNNRKCVDGVWVEGSSLIELDGGPDSDTENTEQDMGPAPTCGDGIVDANEDCDSEEIPNSCEELGFLSGTVTCDADCKNDTTQCVADPKCDNGELDEGEQCDPSVPLSESEKACGGDFDSGEVSCTSACVLDKSGCFECGDGIIATTEVCDSSDFGGKTCESEKGAGFIGSLKCESQCTVINDDDCKSRYVEVSAGGSHTCARQYDGSVTCWGQGTQSIAPTTLFERITTGGIHSCGLRNDGGVECWGGNSQRFENGDVWTEIDQSKPPGELFDKISSGGHHSCGIRKDNKQVQCWGSNYNLLQFNTKQAMYQTTFAIDVSTGASHSCLLEPDGRVSCWGDNDKGQTNEQPQKRFASISAGGFHTCALEDTGLATCWGASFKDDEAILNEGQANAPTSKTFRQISAGGFHSCGLKADGSVECWGSNSVEQSDPKVGPFISISAGYTHTCGVLATGLIECWGSDAQGQRTVVPPS